MRTVTDRTFGSLECFEAPTDRLVVPTGGGVGVVSPVHSRGAELTKHDFSEELKDVSEGVVVLLPPEDTSG